MWHRILVYWGMRDDAVLDDRWTREGVDWRTRVLGWLLGAATLACIVTLAVVLVRLVSGASINLDSALSGGVLLAVALLCLLAAASIAFRLVAWRRTRQRR